ncbi:MAG: helix-turn-helix domain-containing protein, partial [Desulfotomaculales bacterium]
MTTQRGDGMHPGEKIRKLRRAAGYTQEQLAAAAGLSQQYLSDIETGRHRPSLRALETIAGALKTSAAALLETPGARAAAAPPGAGGGEEVSGRHRGGAGRLGHAEAVAAM